MACTWQLSHAPTLGQHLSCHNHKLGKYKRNRVVNVPARWVQDSIKKIALLKAIFNICNQISNLVLSKETANLELSNQAMLHPSFRDHRCTDSRCRPPVSGPPPPLASVLELSPLLLPDLLSQKTNTRIEWQKSPHCGFVTISFNCYGFGKLIFKHREMILLNFSDTPNNNF